MKTSNSGKKEDEDVKINNEMKSSDVNNKSEDDSIMRTTDKQASTVVE